VNSIECVEATAETKLSRPPRVALATLLGTLALGSVIFWLAAGEPRAVVPAVAFGVASASVFRPRAAFRATPSGMAVALHHERELDALGMHELNRARRYERPLTLVSLSFAGSRRDGLRATERVSSCLRQSDLLGHASGRLLIVLTETPGNAIQGLVSRFVTALEDDLAGKTQLGAASFPAEEVTWIGLKTRAVESEAPLQAGRGGSGTGSAGATRPIPLRRGHAARSRLRRAVDLAVVFLVAPVAVPFGLLLAVAIKLDSSGPALIRQPRVGLGGEVLELLKLRTMVKDADGLKDGLSHLNSLAWPDFKIPGDPRVTRVGRFLRRTSLDELPQLWNLLRGDVTLVGPRPCTITVGRYELWQTERLEAKPGLLGRWQAEGRGKVSFADRCRMDIGQIKRQSPAYEFRLALRTLWALAAGRGAS
jgi:lipopolysaccharide/colanic/teichoic acid biosynthesis glycosyltransferase